MINKHMNVMMLIGMFVICCTVLAAVEGCKSDKKEDTTQSAPASQAATETGEKHEAHHGGCLNAIETCALGHAEVKIEGDVMKVWFVGGESQTDKAVRVSDKQIVLTVKPDGGQEKALILEAKPIELAQEKVGDCSYFEGKADWLVGVKKFTATGKVNHTGKERPIKIEYPEGYDPD